jgi:hypothetical protein
MYFSIKNYLKNTRNYNAKHTFSLLDATRQGKAAGFTLLVVVTHARRTLGGVDRIIHS